LHSRNQRIAREIVVNASIIKSNKPRSLMHLKRIQVMIRAEIGRTKAQDGQ
jgi:hypothetical protein